MDESQQAAGASFDLFRDPWITCLNSAGEVNDYGIEQVLTEAHELREIVDPSPLVTVSVLRLLEAVLIWSLEIDDEDRWYDLWIQGRFNEEAMARVGECCGGRMGLFDEVRPFYQSADIDKNGNGERVKSVGSLFPEAATGTTVVHYAHAAEDDHAVCGVCCAKGLVILPPFASSGGQGIKPSINGVPPSYVHPTGESVFQTLLLNWPLASARPAVACTLDPGPAWVSGGIVGHKEECAEVGFVESLSWQSRRVRLLEPRGIGTCTRCGRTGQTLTRSIVFDQGRSRPKEAPPWIDPWAAFVWQTDKVGAQTVRPVRPRPERQTWRDTGALFLATVPQSEADARGRPSRPTIVGQLPELSRLLAADGPTALRGERFLTVSIRTDMKAKMFEWRSDRFEFPSAILSAGAAIPVTRALRLAEAGADALATAFLRLHPAAERDNAPWKDIRAAMADATTTFGREYWAALEPTFRACLFDARLSESEQEWFEWLQEWIAFVRHTAVDELERALNSCDDTAAGLRRREAARRALYTSLKKGGVA